MSEHDSGQVSTLQCPITSNRYDWKVYWEQQGQPWRTEPEIDIERQKYLAERRYIEPDFQRDIYPFSNIKLNRADIEWLLVTYENGRGPVDSRDESQRRRKGLDLRDADLSRAFLRFLPLGGTLLHNTHLMHSSTVQRDLTMLVSQMKSLAQQTSQMFIGVIQTLQ